MRAIKIAAVAVFATLALGALAGASSAYAATNTTICSTASTPCPEANQQPAGALKATSTNVVFSSTNYSVNCSGSTLNGSTTSAAGDPLPVSFTGLSLSGCTVQNQKKTACTATELHSPTSGSLTWTSEGKGSLAVQGGETGWSFKFECGALINCSYEMAPGMSASGSTLQASGVKSSRAWGGLCTGTLSMSGTYAVETPSSFHVSIAEEGDTQLCKSSANAPFCASADLYPTGTTVEAESANVELRTDFAHEPIHCTGALEGVTQNAGAGGQLPLAGGEFALTGCERNGHSCQMSNGKSTEWEFEWQSGWEEPITLVRNGDPLEFTFWCGPVTVPYATVVFEGVEASVEGGAPAHIVFAEVGGSCKGGDSIGCTSAAVRMSADLTVTSPSPLYVTHN